MTSPGSSRECDRVIYWSAPELDESVGRCRGYIQFVQMRRRQDVPESSCQRPPDHSKASKQSHTMRE